MRTNKSILIAQLAAMSGIFAGMSGSPNRIWPEPRQPRNPVVKMVVSSREEIAAWNAKVDEEKHLRRIENLSKRSSLPSTAGMSRRQARRLRSSDLRAIRDAARVTA